MIPRVAIVLAVALSAGTLAAQQDPRAPSDGTSLAARVAEGDSAWGREDHPAALRAYAAVLRADSSYSSRAAFRVGLLNAWRDRFAPSLAALRLYVKLEPDDGEGRIALARTYAWAGQFPQSLAQYDSIIAQDTTYRDAVIGRAQALAWADRIPEAEASLVAWLNGHPTDADAWVQVAQFRRWRGEPHAAAEALERALVIAPNHADARTQLQWTQADTRPAALGTLVVARDSENNMFTLTEVGGTVLTRSRVRATVTGRHRNVSVGASPRTDVPGAHAQLQWQPSGSSWTLRAEGGVVQYSPEPSGTTVHGRAALRANGRVGQRVRVGVGAGREPFDEVYSMAARAMMFAVADADVAYQWSSKLSLGLAGSRGEASGIGIRDARSTGLAALRYTPRAGVSLAVTQREISWDEPAFGIFFAPQRWSVTEGSVAWERSAELGLVLRGDLAVGSQGIAFEGGPIDRSIAPRASMRFGWRPVPGREVIGSLVYANVAGAGTITASDYRYGAFTLTGRWTF